MNIQLAQTLSKINTRAQSITTDYHATILPNSILVTHNDDPKRSYVVTDGKCTCPAFAHYQTCKHLLGLEALIDAEITRLSELCTVQDCPTFRNAIQSGIEIMDAHLCGMDLETYRSVMQRED